MKIPQKQKSRHSDAKPYDLNSVGGFKKCSSNTNESRIRSNAYDLNYAGFVKKSQI